MNLLQNFIHFIKKENLFKKNEPVLLTVSGGVDSIVMADLFHRAKFNFAIAHCNFQLRGNESDEDEKFVKAIAKKYRVEFFTIKFDTKKYAKNNKVSIQEAARNLRYDWFFRLLSERNFTCCATAHHLNDNMETFFINLLRGTGISGLAGIIPKTEDRIIRPLLFLTRKEIEHYAEEKKLKFRNDSSNLSDDYLRNKIRHHLVPVMEKLNASFEKTMARNLHNLQFAEYIYENSMIEEMVKHTHHTGGMPYFSRKELQRLNFPVDYLYEFLNPFHFNASQVQEIWDCNQSGKVFYSDSFRVVCDRDKIILALFRKTDDLIYPVKKGQKTFKHHSFSLRFKALPLTAKKPINLPADPAVSCLDLSLLRFPLTIRKWQAGDSFYPLGMKHRKKVSDFLVDNKFSLPEKEKVYVLLSGNDIVCIPGHRVDNRYKVSEDTKSVYCIDYLSNLE